MNVILNNFLYFFHLKNLNLLVTNFGIISTWRIPTQFIYVDSPSTSKKINMTLCNVPIELYCRNNTYFYLSILEQNY